MNIHDFHFEGEGTKNDYTKHLGSPSDAIRKY